uniref:rab GTPase-activating protein 1-like isoform X2 n=1 Tax=Myxine glutinosa TaxID=7769 RepID=UPI00358FC41B
MMTEVSISDAYDAHVFGTLKDGQEEEENLAKVLTIQRPSMHLPKHKKLNTNLTKNGDKPFRTSENVRKLQKNMQLEQENDDLARQLLSCKIALRSDLDQAEDRADAVNKELLLSRHHLIKIENERQTLHEETSRLKEDCRSDLAQAEDTICKNKGIIKEYKQICSQLSKQLDEMELRRKHEKECVQKWLGGCANCSRVLEQAPTPSETALAELNTPQLASTPSPSEPDSVPESQHDTSELSSCEKLTGIAEPSNTEPCAPQRPSDQHMQEQLRDMEQELAMVKLEVVQAECKIQDLEHDLVNTRAEASKKSSWFNRSFGLGKNVTTSLTSTKESE